MWRGLRFGALLGNLLYVSAILVAAGVLIGLGKAPWRAYANVVAVLAVLAATITLNVKAVRGRVAAVGSAAAIVLNLACLAYLALAPEYSLPALRCAVVLVPLLNVAIAVAGWRRAHTAARTGART